MRDPLRRKEERLNHFDMSINETVNTPQEKLVFEDFTYERPDMETFSNRFEALLQEFEEAGSAAAQKRIFSQLNDMRTELLTMYNLCHIRHTMDTQDEFYEAENDFFDQQMPSFQALVTRLYQVVLDSPFREELEKSWGAQFFRVAELSLKTFIPEILEDLREENRLSSEYIKLKATARIEFQGEEYNLSSIQKLEVNPDRQTRREAAEAKWDFYATHIEKTDHVYEQLVHTRHRIARKLGYDNFVQLGYDRLGRSDYGPEQVARFRREVKEHIVPAANALYERQRRRLGLEQLKYYDEEYRFPSGNPEPKGDPKWIITHAGTMYEELSSETKAFFNYMRNKHLMDLETRPGKATGGYCTYIGKYKSPFIFSNFNGTSGDIDVLTHEAGHAFQVYASRDFQINEYIWPTLEACEIHSMSMEFFTWPWMRLFFEEDTEKYRFAHLANALLFMPYGVAIDEFQHFVYENPDCSPAERRAAWRRIEGDYLPHRDYDGNAFLEDGGYWHKQTHVFSSPFYYIDYVLAQTCALQFWKRNTEDHQSAWSDYLTLCRAGGSRPFLDLVELSGLQSPFDPGVLQEVVGEAGSWLDRIDDAEF